MKTLEQRNDGQNVLHSNKSPQEVLREQYSDTCILKPHHEPLRSTRPGMDYCRTWHVMDCAGCEKGDPNYTGSNLVELP